jgi:Na+/H+-translocating membrane pyrophosphatase
VPVIGYFVGFETLAGFLSGLVVSSILLSLFLTNTGNCFETAKNAFEQGIEIEGQSLSTDSSGYRNSITGNRAVNPMTEAISPAILILMKLALLTAIIIGSSIL